MPISARFRASLAKRVMTSTRRPMMARAAVVVQAARRNRTRVRGAITGARRPELKYVDLAQANYACDTTGSVTALNLLAVGDDNNTRDGRQVVIKSVQLHGMVYPQDNTTLHTKARVMLVWDNAVNSGTIATIAQILTAANGTAFPLIDNANRFTILVDRMYAVGMVDNTATTSFAASPTVSDCEIYKLINQVTQYSGTTAAIGSIQNGGLLLVTIGSSPATQAANLLASVRVRYTDM